MRHRWIVGCLGLAGAGCLLGNPAFGDGDTGGGATGGATSGASTSSPATTTGLDPSTDGSGATSSEGSGSDGATTGALTTTTTNTTTGATDSGSGGTTAVAPGCMNGVVEPDEQCDDGNAIDDDACTNQCHNRPTGVVFGPAVRGTIYGVQNVIGSWKKSDVCGPGQALIALIGSNRFDLNVWELVGRCGTLTIPAGGAPVVKVEPAQILDPHGAGGNISWSSDCPIDQIVVGLSVRADNAGLYQLSVHCAPLVITETADGFTVMSGAPTKLPLQPSQTAKGQLAEAPCDAAVGTYVHDLEVPGQIGALALQCATYTLTP